MMKVNQAVKGKIQEKSVKVQLTLSIKRIENEFKASNYMVQKAKPKGYFVNAKPKS